MPTPEEQSSVPKRGAPRADAGGSASASETVAHTIEQHVVDLHVSGMTCASCVMRVERKLNKLDGVSASVDLATESAHVVAAAHTTVDTLIAAVRSAGYDAAPRQHASELAADAERRMRDMQRRLIVSTILGLPVVAMSMVMPWQFVGWQWWAAVLSAPIAWWCAWPFHSVALRQLRHRSSSMDTLVSLGVAASWLGSTFALLRAGALAHRESWFTYGSNMTQHETPHVWFEVVAAVTTFLLLGRILEHRATRESGEAIRALLALQATTARRLKADGTTEVVPTEFLLAGDHVVVSPGEVVPVDGVIIDGSTAVDESMLTGESLPVQAMIGDNITGGTIVITGRVSMRATAVGAATRIAQIGELVMQAQSRKSATQRLADKISGVFVPIVLIITAVTAVVWQLLGDSTTAFTAALAVLVVACPCALGLATPTAMLAGVGAGARVGILISGPEVLERAARINTLIFDKTGTLTSGDLTVVATTTIDDVGEWRWQVLTALAQSSNHPVSQAVALYARTKVSAQSLTVTDVHETAGIGVQARADNHLLRLGRPEWAQQSPDSARPSTEHPGLEMASTGHDVTVRRNSASESNMSSRIVQWQRQGWSVVIFSIDGIARLALAVADTVRPQSSAVVRRAAEQGLTPWLVTGDHAGVANHIARLVGIAPKNVMSGATPETKMHAVSTLQTSGHAVAMVGDGINDAAALATADIGIAMGGGTGAAIAAGDITLVGSRVELVLPSLQLARRTLRIIRQNLTWAFGYNVVMIPLAATGALNPMIAGFAMASSSVLVVSNSLRLRRFVVSQ